MPYRPKDMLVLLLARWGGISIKTSAAIFYGAGRWSRTFWRR